MVIVDIYPLTPSEQFDLKSTEEARVDLTLKKQPPAPETKLIGKVRTNYTKPVYKATVKILDKNYNPIAHTFTNEEGKYIFENILLPGEYKLTAAAIGFLTAHTINFTIKEKKTKIINIKLKKDPSTGKGVIYGLIMDAKTYLTIPNALLVLLNKENKLAAKTISNSQGQYLFCNIEPGKYSVLISKNGYFSSSILVTVEKGVAIKSDIPLYIDSETLCGTISGLITSGNKPLKNAYVGLYKIKNEIETLIQNTTTNYEGLYLFTNVDTGQYVVKSKLENSCEYTQNFFIEDSTK